MLKPGIVSLIADMELNSNFIQVKKKKAYGQGLIQKSNLKTHEKCIHLKESAIYVPMAGQFDRKVGEFDPI